MSQFNFSTSGIMLAVMALTTYFIRVTPMALFHRKLDNRWFKDFMFYIPFCVLAAMTFPDVIYSTTPPNEIYSTKHLTSGVVATVVAIIMSWRKRDLLTVAIGAVLAAVLVEYLMIVMF